MGKSTCVVVDKTNLPIWVNEELPIKKCYEVTAERSIEETFEIFNTEVKNELRELGAKTKVLRLSYSI